MYRLQSENARATMDLYRSYEGQWEGEVNLMFTQPVVPDSLTESIKEAIWPCALPPVAYSRCYT